jgi:hypothetical protein
MIAKLFTMPDNSGVMLTSGSVEIDKPIEVVFEYTNNNVAEWSTIVVADEVIEKKQRRREHDISVGDGRTRETDGVRGRGDAVRATHREYGDADRQVV